MILPNKPLLKSKVPHVKSCAVIFKLRMLILKFVYYISLRNWQNVYSGEAGENPLKIKLPFLNLLAINNKPSI